MKTLTLNGLEYKLGQHNKVFYLANDTWFKSEMTTEEFDIAFKDGEYRELVAAVKPHSGGRLAPKTLKIKLSALINSGEFSEEAIERFISKQKIKLKLN